MYAFIPIIFLFPPAVLILIVLAFRNRAGIGKSSGSGKLPASEEADINGVPAENGFMDDDYDTLQGFEAASLGNDDIQEAYSNNEEPEADGAYLSAAADSGETDAQKDADLKAEKKYKQLMLAAVLVFITGVILTVTLYLGIKVTPWSGWWPDWLFK